VARLLALSLIFWSALATAAEIEVGWLTLVTDRGEQINTLFARPKDPAPAPRPAVIYNHGTEVRLQGYSERGDGTDVRGFAEKLAGEGFIALAPIREFERTTAVMPRGRPSGGPDAWDAVIEGGLRTVAAARRRLEAMAEVDPSRIGLLGFSEGGNVSLWAASETPFRAVVLLAPAAISPSPRYRLVLAANEATLGRIQAPLFLAVAANDLPPVRDVVIERIAPLLARLNPDLVFRSDYPGGHDLFWRPRDAFWPDVAAFLRTRLAKP